MAIFGQKLMTNHRTDERLSTARRPIPSFSSSEPESEVGNFSLFSGVFFGFDKIPEFKPKMYPLSPYIVF